MITTQKEIQNTIRQCFSILEKQFKVKKIGLFGSFSRNEATEESDVDFVVEFYEPLGWEFFDLQDFLEKKLGRKVDLVPLHGLKPRWNKVIAKDIVYL